MRHPRLSAGDGQRANADHRVVVARWILWPGSNCCTHSGLLAVGVAFTPDRLRHAPCTTHARMFHLVAHATSHTFLFHTWAEGLMLWERILTEVPRPEALVLMPDHVHLLHDVDVRRRLAH